MIYREYHIVNCISATQSEKEGVVKCSNPLAKQKFGEFPSKGVCANCPFRTRKVAEEGPIIIGAHSNVTNNINRVNPFSESGFISHPAYRKPITQVSHWGPNKWNVLHAWATTADLNDIPHWMEGFTNTIPCHVCIDEWTRIVREFPPPNNSNLSLCLWTFDMHNKVNAKLNKQQPTYEAMREKYGWPKINTIE